MTIIYRLMKNLQPQVGNDWVGIILMEFIKQIELLKKRSTFSDKSIFESRVFEKFIYWKLNLVFNYFQLNKIKRFNSNSKILNNYFQ